MEVTREKESVIYVYKQHVQECACVIHAHHYRMTCNRAYQYLILYTHTHTCKILNKCLKWCVSASISDFLHNYKNLSIAVNPYVLISIMGCAEIQQCNKARIYSDHFGGWRGRACEFFLHMITSYSLELKDSILRSLFFWDVRQHRLVVHYQCSGSTCQSQVVQDCLSDRLTQNIQNVSN